MLRLFIICLVSLVANNGFSQGADWMIPPVKHKVRLAGTFGELRNNHFHTGVDIKSSNGMAGDQVLAVADGFISRIKISSTGYGNALYIDHPNGLTTVYAHLKSLEVGIADFLDSCQYAMQSFEIDTLLPPNLIKVEQGQQIGIMGNSGRSYGPHLHFEIRETKSEVPFNPLAHGVKITDDVAPQVNYVTLNYLDNEYHKQGSQKISLQKNGNHYTPSKSNTIKVPAWRVGISVFTRDLMTGVSNRNGIYSAKLKVDDQDVFSFKMDSISFDDFRYLNAHIDYEHYKENKHRIHQLYRKPGNHIPIYQESENQVVKLYAEKERKIDILISDFDGNQSTISFGLLRDTSMVGHKEKVFQYFLKHDEAHIINRDDVKIRLEENTLYEDLFLSVERSEEKELNYVSPVFHIGDDHTAVHRPFDLYIARNEVDSALLDKIIVVSCEKNKYYSYGGEVLENLVGAKVKTLGAYVLMIDTIPPTIVAKSVPSEVKNGTRIQFTIDDNITVKGQASDPIYNAWIDDKWILMRYDMKSKTLSHYVDNRWTAGKHAFKLEVVDDRGNTSTYEKVIIKK